MDTSQNLNFSVKQGIGHLIIDRPPVNALGRELIQDLTKFAIGLNKMIFAGQADVRALILSANGNHFCAGADLKERQSMSEDQVEKAVTATREMTNAMANISVPVIAAIHSSAIGGGMELALAADLRVLAVNATMGLRETALAIIPGAGGTQRLPCLIGPSKAMYWITSAKIFSAYQCLQDGVANFVVNDADLLNKAREIAGEIAQNGPIAVRAAKEAIVRGLDVEAHIGMEIERQSYARIIPTEDRLEALKAFQEKRPPVFKGR